MNESQLVARIKAHIATGDRNQAKAEEHYISAGQYLKTLKAHLRSCVSQAMGRRTASLAGALFTVPKILRRGLNLVLRTTLRMPMRDCRRA